MRLKKSFIGVLLFAGITAVFSLGTPFYSDDSALLTTILDRCSDYCEILQNSALSFVCLENIKEEIILSAARLVRRRAGGHIITYKTPPVREKNEYIYDYQLVKKGKKIEENRVLVEENGEKKNIKNASLKTKRFFSLRSVLGPVGLFKKDLQESFIYALDKEEKLNGRKTYVVDVTPNNSTVKTNYGKVWVDKEDFTILKIEMEQESLFGFERLQNKRMRLIPSFKTTHFYEIKKKGIRFPSKTVFEEYYRGRQTPKFKRSKVEIVYDKYRFFTVETKVKY